MLDQSSANATEQQLLLGLATEIALELATEISAMTPMLAAASFAERESVLGRNERRKFWQSVVESLAAKRLSHSIQSKITNPAVLG